MVYRKILHEALGAHPDNIGPIVDKLVHHGIGVLYKKKMVSKIVGDILDNKHFQKKEVSPLIQISKQLQYIITAIRVVYDVEVRREVLGRFVPTLLNLINDEIRQYGIAMKISEHAHVINSRTHIKIIRVGSGEKKGKSRSIKKLIQRYREVK